MPTKARSSWIPFSIDLESEGSGLLKDEAPKSVRLYEVENSSDERSRTGSQAMTVPAGTSTGRLWLDFDFSSGLNDFGFVNYGLGQEILIAYRAGNVERTLSLTLNVLPGRRVFSVQNPAKPGYPLKFADVFFLITIVVTGEGGIDWLYDLSTVTGPYDDPERHVHRRVLRIGESSGRGCRGRCTLPSLTPEN